MVDAIGVNRVAAADLVRASTATTAQAASSETAQAGAVSTGVGQSSPDTATSAAIALSKKLAVAPPVDAARVAEIRKAIADGTFPILPATIADRMLALKLDWTTHDKA